MEHESLQAFGSDEERPEKGDWDWLAQGGLAPDFYWDRLAEGGPTPDFDWDCLAEGGPTLGFDVECPEEGEQLTPGFE